MASENTAFQFSFPKDRAILLLPLPISGKRVDLSKREIEFRNMECICAHMRVHVHTYTYKHAGCYLLATGAFIIFLWVEMGICSSPVFLQQILLSESESHSVVPNSLWPHGVLQARILQWVAFPFSRGSSQPRDRTHVSCIAGRFFTSWATREAQEFLKCVLYACGYAIC